MVRGFEIRNKAIISFDIFWEKYYYVWKYQSMDVLYVKKAKVKSKSKNTKVKSKSKNAKAEIYPRVA